MTSAGPHPDARTEDVSNVQPDAVTAHPEAQSDAAIARRFVCARLAARALPGYPQRKLGPQRHRIPVPSCQATYADMIEIPAGEFIYGGPGEPPSPTETTAEEVLDLPSYSIDRHELANALGAKLAAATTAPDLVRRFRSDAPELAASYRPDSPITNVNYATALALCRMAGKRLVRGTEWTKAMRGGRFIRGSVNETPRRNLPWGLVSPSRRANIAHGDHPPLIHGVAADNDDIETGGIKHGFDVVAVQYRTANFTSGR